ncbi:LOW QUALITY PROTEIN: dnaJ homolog subfamily C member 14 [Myiozetetes cayanensis]|uniref:LOW QUALITY PROTEIN: dnaJ homolog subfamily C member 14 n=1 Tax=Myiozetetes cayanensis TaxID=478635 RepID=UPI00215F7D78|nr:LOW QUALITY PROTEIN: dnaJ homolog subfamily C member 14 [Myiozetetes cayanensis]
MEQPRPRDAAEGVSSAAWNGTCGRAGTAPGPGDDEEDGGGSGDPGTPCGCRGPLAPTPSPAGEPRAGACGLGCRHRGAPDGDGRARRARRWPRHRGAPRENEEEEEEEGGGLRGWGRGSLRAARAGAGLCLRLLGALLALLLLLFLLLLGGLRLCWRGLTAGARRARELLGDPRQWLRGRRSPPGIPTAGEEELGRLLALAEVPEEELNPFQVLGVEPSAADAELRKAYRRLAVLVHPDKSPHPRAEEAFKVLQAGWDRVSSPERRRDYETKRLAQSELARSVGAFLSRLQEDLREAMNAMACSRCGGRHRRFELDRDPQRARYCAECGGLHPAEEGDLWAESHLLGLRITYMARMDGRVYDITEWAGCQRVGISPDTHRVPYHLSFGARAPPPGRQRTTPKGSPPTPSELQDFLARIFQTPAAPGGPFPPPPPPGAAPPGGPPRPEGVPPRGDTKHKRRKKVRRPLPR